MFELPNCERFLKTQSSKIKPYIRAKFWKICWIVAKCTVRIEITD